MVSCSVGVKLGMGGRPSLTDGCGDGTAEGSLVGASPRSVGSCVVVFVVFIMEVGIEGRSTPADGCIVGVDSCVVTFVAFDSVGVGTAAAEFVRISLEGLRVDGTAASRVGWLEGAMVGIMPGVGVL